MMHPITVRIEDGHLILGVCPYRSWRHPFWRWAAFIVIHGDNGARAEYHKPARSLDMAEALTYEVYRAIDSGQAFS